MSAINRIGTGPAARRPAAIRALVDIGTDDAVFALGSMLSASDAEKRRSGRHCAGDIGGRAALGYVYQALSGPDPGDRAEAAAVVEGRGLGDNAEPAGANRRLAWPASPTLEGAR